ncbi:hypothetical protein SAMN05421736_101149 [Evansella caseinilytica]|uniref:Uncharacterized protein n=1 Tax=Evansella caseinilytica TaxID=1503961 RepID=A0A1H3GFI2_9BACI|nr:hypothetical protein [Evansella caseinilytica]SDY01785.1 hypothetical protein SAMN05421736_101149 [Evansella caseinilytica]
MQEEHQRLQDSLNEVELEESRSAFSEIFNLALRILNAMAENDYDFLEEHSSETVTIDRENNSFIFKDLDGFEQAFVTHAQLTNLYYPFFELN